jgi:serine phosphatase RsbU (regulator of sigma subunit)
MALLQVLKGPTPGQQFKLDREKSILGRHPDCDIVLDVGAISRQHAQILMVGPDFFVQDLQSRNGTFVNGQQVHEMHRLEENDRIKICDLLFTFHTKAPSPKSTESQAPGVGRLTSLAEMVDDVEGGIGSTVVGKVDVGSSREGLRFTVNAEAKLKALLEINQSLASALSLDQVLPKILDSLFRVFLQADRGFVVLQESENARLVPKAVKHRRADSDETPRISRTIMKEVMTKKEAILSADAATDGRFDSSQSIAEFRIRSMMCAPLVDSTGRALGAIQIDTLDKGSRFQQDDLEVLASVASQAAIAIENAQLHERQLGQRAMERDLELAHKVQQGFLPGAPPKVEGYDFFDFYKAASHVGGDYFDYIMLSGQRIGIVLADVSGKGISAALLTAKLSSEARFCLASESGLATAVNRLNAAFCASGWEDRFVTVIIGVLDPQKNELTIVNGGHMAPYLRHRNGTVEPIGEEQSGVPLGVDADFEYDQFTIPLAQGDCLTLFTDGFSEAMNAAGELYGLERLQQHLTVPDVGVAKLGPLLLEDVKSFVDGHNQSDDMCLVCFGRR